MSALSESSLQGSDMRPSSRYRAMARTISELRTSLLPSPFSPTGSYPRPKRVHIHTASFRVLSHAEIESYFEDRAVEVQSLAWELWKHFSRPSHTLTCLLGFSGVATFSPAESLSKASGNQKAYIDVAVPLEKANNVWRSTVSLDPREG